MVAIVAAYNEADIVGQVVADLIAQGVGVYALDDGSSDGTVAAIEPFVGRGVLAIESLPRDAASAGTFDWERILHRKTALAQELDADWFIHHDADEFRESPWHGVPLRDAIARVDRAGFNAIDFASLDFWPIDDRFRPGDDVRTAFTHYAQSAAYDALQVKCWKKRDAPVDLASSGGHEVQFPDRRVFPLRFISRHYPIRGQAHGVRKVFGERRGRFAGAERERGWHVQYDAVADGASFLRDPATLTRYDPDAVRLSLTLRHREVEALEASVAERGRLADARGREIETLRRTLACTQDEIQRVRALLEAGTRDLDTRTRDLAAAREALEAAREQLEATRHESRLRAEEISSAAEFVAHQARTIDGLHDALAHLERRVDELRRSLSWRLTAPVRALARAVRGR